MSFSHQNCMKKLPHLFASEINQYAIPNNLHGPFHLPIITDWPSNDYMTPPGNLLARRFQAIFNDSRGLLSCNSFDKKLNISNTDNDSCKAMPTMKKQYSIVLPINKTRDDMECYKTLYQMDYNLHDNRNLKDCRSVSIPEQLKVASSTVNLIKRCSTLHELRPQADDKAFMRWSIPQNLLHKSAKVKKPEITTDSIPIQDGYQNQTKVVLTNEKNNSRIKTDKNAKPISEDETIQETKKTGAEQLNCEVKVSEAVKNIVENCNPSERREILRPFVLNNKIASHNLFFQIMSPKAECYVKKWLQTAMPLEREAALHILHKVVLEKQKDSKIPVEKRIEELLQNIRNHFNRNSRSKPHPIFSHGDGSTNLKYLNLLTKQNRRDCWMYKTWHHLPPYMISKEAALRDNHKSHYVHLTKYKPNEYIVHPDLG